MKGILQSLESIIAILAILTVFVTVFGGRDTLPEFDTVNWKIRGFNALKTLDDNNRLRDVATANSTAVLYNRLSTLIPSSINYNVTICHIHCAVPPNSQSDKLTSVSYLIAGDLNSYLPRQIILYLW